MQHKYSFFDDYSEGAHPQILQALIDCNNKQAVSYGMDEFSLRATDLIREKINNSAADVYFITSGTQANLLGLSWLLKSYESVIAVQTGHICVHESGAIEATGHKINIETSQHGKITPEIIQGVVDRHNMDQMVKPKTVYLSQSTELGTVYNKTELKAISDVCKKNNLYLYIDGARLPHALAIEKGDLTIRDIADCCDMFYIGGTKNGGLIGEAFVIVNAQLKENFRFHLRQKGALLAKTRAISVQFLAFFNNDLYLQVAHHANSMAQQLKRGLAEKGGGFMIDSPTNQLFPILPNTIIERLEKLYGFYQWNKIDDKNTAIRLVTSWATQPEIVEMFLNDLHSL